MGLVIYIIISWLVLTVFFSSKKKLPSNVNIILFLAIQIVQINIFTIITLKMNLFTFGKDPVEFITVLIYRDLIIPYLLLLFVNQLSFAKIPSNRILITAVILTLLLVFEHLLRILGYSHNHHWSIWHFSLVCIGLMVYSLLIVNLLMKLASKEKQEYNGPSNL
ncbi:hypothetical protein V7139_27885 [Neobacillus drentensis]|uniref:hypothetical protein n=1 Tax=Neobacillus drentensis TaxID=220684 RepID=UPI0030003E4E